MRKSASKVMGILLGIICIFSGVVPGYAQQQDHEKVEIETIRLGDTVAMLTGEWEATSGFRMAKTVYF